MRWRWLMLGFSLLGLTGFCCSQQKGQWVTGQYGLNAGVVPDAGLTYLNLALTYSAGQLNDSNGHRISGLTGTYSFWVDQNVFMYVPKHKIFGGHFAPYASLNLANGSLVAEITGTNLSVQGGVAGLADTFIVPVNFGWHFNRADFSVGYGFFAPTGHYRAGASDNVGSGYWGNHFISGTTYYITKNKTTSANVFIDWEEHGQKATTFGTRMTPGQAFTMEWGVGQLLPLNKKTMDSLLQIGFVGYDQWQVSDDGGAIGSLSASLLPYYSAHALGFQTNFIVPPKGLNLFFKYYDEYSAKAHPQGRTIVFGGSWTMRIPKPTK